MEDIIALVIVVGVLALFVWGTVTLIKRVKREQQREAELQAKSDKYWADLRAKNNSVEIPESMKKYVKELDKDGSKTNIKAVNKPIEVPPRGKETTVKYPSASAGAPSKPAPSENMNRYSEALARKWSTDQPTSSSDDGFLTGAVVGYALNTILHSGETRSEERSVGIRSSESSWGFEDSSSHKAVEDTFSSSSDSWSDSSDVSSDW